MSQSTCRHCNETIDNPADHHLTEHPNRQYDPLWYIQNDNWSETNDPEKIITDAEIERCFQNANYGEHDYRDILFSSLIKVLGGYATGHTTERILQEMGLVRGEPSVAEAELTDRAKYYVFHVVENELDITL